jgi:hypothetical protein
MVRTLDAKPTFGGPLRLGNRSLFHYTTAQGLIGILRTQTLFATHADFLNDSSECRLLREVLQPQLIKEFKEIAPKLVAAGIMSEAKVVEYGDSASEEFATAIFNTMVRSIEKISPIYITSFCLHGPKTPEFENGLLSQWRGYANGGFAVEFDEKGLDQLASAEVAAFRYEGILTSAVAYDGHAERADLKRFQGVVSAALKINFADRGLDASGVLGDHEMIHFLKPFFEAVPFLKASGFKEESEYRMVSLAYRKSAPVKPELPLRNIKFRASANGSVVPYIAVFEDSGLKLPIKSILIGPHPNQDNQETAVRLLLDQFDIAAAVRRSKLTLRS